MAAALPLQGFFMDVHEMYMHRCLQLAAPGSGFAAPNPLVGAVLVHEDRIIGEGLHEKYGRAHAEVNCLNSVKEADRHLIPDSTLYVSLEPCAHFGKTPPCANRILQEGIKKVVVGVRDPFEQVNGKGIEILINAGVVVTVGVLEAECRMQNRRFFTFHEKSRPYVHLKWAQTADGFMAAGSETRLKISGPVADRFVHRLRAEEMAIMVGTQTALLDNPQLNNRLWSGPQPLRVVVDRQLRLPATAALLSDGGKTLVLNGIKDEIAGVIHYKKVNGLEARNPAVILKALFDEKIQGVLIEGGADFLQSFLQAGQWDEAHVLTNTKLMAGKGIKAPVLPNGRRVAAMVLQNDRIEWILNNDGNL